MSINNLDCFASYNKIYNIIIAHCYCYIVILLIFINKIIIKIINNITIITIKIV